MADSSKPSSTPTWKRILAWIAIAALVALYVVTLVLALLSHPGAADLFRFSLTMTVVIPIMLWIILYAIGHIHK